MTALFPSRSPPQAYFPPVFKWDGTGGVSDTHSYEWILLNAIYERLSQSTFFSGFTVKRISDALPIEGGYQIPFLGVFQGETKLGPEGGGNQGELRFTNNFVIGIQIVVQDNDPVKMRDTLDEAYWFVMNRLWRDDSFTNLLTTTMPDNTRFEAVPTIRRHKPRWGKNASANETPVGIQQIDITLFFRTDFYPTEFQDLERITVTTAFPPGSTPEEQQKIQQVKIVYQFNPDSVPTPLPPDP
jgi:hypothetical protein